jgi:hypothetical protein
VGRDRRAARSAGHPARAGALNPLCRALAAAALGLAGLLPGVAEPLSAAAGAPPAEHGAVWRLAGAHNAVYIAGSVHLLGDRDASLPPPLQEAYLAARRIVMEIDLDDLDPDSGVAFTTAHGTWPAGSPGLRDRLGARRWSRVDAACTRVGVPCDGLDRLEPWAAALLLSVSELMRQGLDPALGVEEQIRQRARADGKPIAGLETIEYQLGLFDGLAEREQRRLLDLTTTEILGDAPELDALTDAWRRGDLARLDRLLLREYRRFPALYEALVYRRNAAWVPRIRELLDDREDVLVIVGTLHLVGRKGLIAMLEDEGLAPQRVRAAPFRAN